MIRNTRILAFAFLPILLAGCAGNQSDPKIRSVLDSQVVAWNAGDIEGFMQGYWKSDELVFVSPKGETRGWQPTLDRYKQRYPTREKMGHLQFSDLVIRPIAADSAEVTGRWSVQTTTTHATGGFTLDMRRINDHWVIVKDHTTADEST